MELTDIMALVKAGYTKDEIAQMAQPVHNDPNTAPVQQTTVGSEPVPEPAPAPAPVVEPVAVPAPVPTPAPAEPTMADVMQSLAKLTSAIQANAIAQSVIPAGMQTPVKAEDMLAEIIRPTYKEKNHV